MRLSETMQNALLYARDDALIGGYRISNYVESRTRRALISRGLIRPGGFLTDDGLKARARLLEPKP